MKADETWVLIADGTRARIVRDSDRQNWKEEDLLFEFDHKQLGEIMSDRPGRSLAYHHQRDVRPGFRTASDVPEDIDPGLREYMLRVYNFMAGGLIASGLTGYAAAQAGFYQRIAETPLIWIVMLAPLGAVFFLGFRIDRMSAAAARLTFWIYAILMGLSLTGIVLVYTGASIARAFLIAAATFGAMSLYGYLTGRDLTRVGSFLFMGLIGIVLASVVNLFVASAALEFAVSVVGVAIFVGLTAYDTQRIKEIYVEGDEALSKKALIGALTLYLDFINLFVMFLHLTGERRD